MKKQALSKLEMETVVNYNRGEDMAELYTADRTVMTKLDKLCKQAPENYKLIKQDSISKTYLFSKKLLSFRSGKRNLNKEKTEQV